MLTQGALLHVMYAFRAWVGLILYMSFPCDGVLLDMPKIYDLLRLNSYSSWWSPQVSWHLDNLWLSVWALLGPGAILKLFIKRRVIIHRGWLYSKPQGALEFPYIIYLTPRSLLTLALQALWDLLDGLHGPTKRSNSVLRILGLLTALACSPAHLKGEAFQAIQ